MIKVEFIKSHVLNRLKWKVGHKAMMEPWLANELIEKNIVREYKGEWPPKKTKTKIKLKDLK